MLSRLLITLFDRVYVPASVGGAPHGSTAALNAELASLGYTMSPSLMARVNELDTSAFLLLRTELHADLRQITGASSSHRTLYAKFPYDTPDHYDYLVRRILGYMQNDGLIATPNDVTILSCGHVIDNRMFNLAEFGACPICQRQVDEIDERPPYVKYPYAQLTPLKILGAADDAFLSCAASTLLARMSSLSTDERAFIREVHDQGFALDRPSAVYRETLPLMYTIFYDDAAYVASLLSGATDVMRIATYLSDPAADLSLATPTRYRLRKYQVRDMLDLLERLASRTPLASDMMRHRERWLRLGEVLHPGTPRHRRQYPAAAGAFDNLRRAPSSIATLSRAVERKLRARHIDAELLALLSTRPGEMLRRADVLLRNASDVGLVYRHVLDAARKAPTPLVLQVAKHFASRSYVARGDRVFFPKGRVNRVQIVRDRRREIPASTAAGMSASLSGVLIERFAALPALGATYIDPRLNSRLIPFNRRGDASTSRAVVKGSRYPFDGPVVRLFVHWTGRDVDLSMVAYDESFVHTQHVAFTNTKTAAAYHSGDVQRAPNGATEFIDFDVAKLRASGARYAVAVLISYTGEPFSEFPCFAGYMERDAMRSGRPFEPASVALKFDVTMPARSALPLIFDLEQREVIFADLSTGGRCSGAVHGQDAKFSALARAAVGLVDTKPSLGDLLTLHAAARGSIVQDPDEATTVFTADVEIPLDPLLA